MTSSAGSGGAGLALAHICWLGHPWHAEALPASVLSVPGQCSGIASVSAEIKIEMIQT